MCRAEICSICHRKSWTGCGSHIASVMDNTPKENWCTCEGVDDESGTYPPKAGTGFARKSSS
ncbi:hypothetical protein CLIB1423_08S04522 [[Candida] railenensis]|uniref:Uncharacterized protein n=1 Tax=[Candida] railenensis TaxID=45579 RepID=A0A9P0QQD0_9ASCO|nr:hypothetical protein CLIB1423_08S04522 [[Candida] railenensis]